MVPMPQASGSIQSCESLTEYLALALRGCSRWNRPLLIRYWIPGLRLPMKRSLLLSEHRFRDDLVSLGRQDVRSRRKFGNAGPNCWLRTWLVPYEQSSCDAIQSMYNTASTCHSMKIHRVPQKARSNIWRHSFHYVRKPAKSNYANGSTMWKNKRKHIIH